jgi:hypothetical protein
MNSQQHEIYSAIIENRQLPAGNAESISRHISLAKELTASLLSEEKSNNLSSEHFENLKLEFIRAQEQLLRSLPGTDPASDTPKDENSTITAPTDKTPPRSSLPELISPCDFLEASAPASFSAPEPSFSLSTPPPNVSKNNPEKSKLIQAALSQVKPNKSPEPSSTEGNQAAKQGKEGNSGDLARNELSATPQQLEGALNVITRLTKKIDSIQSNYKQRSARFLQQFQARIDTIRGELLSRHSTLHHNLSNLHENLQSLISSSAQRNEKLVQGLNVLLIENILKDLPPEVQQRIIDSRANGELENIAVKSEQIEEINNNSAVNPPEGSDSSPNKRKFDELASESSNDVEKSSKTKVSLTALKPSEE